MMIKFFRHIRKSLLMENKTSKYFKYAIGEIILVVIGILIALQINNWNESKKQLNEAKSYLKNITAFLDDDLFNTFELYTIKSADSILYYINSKDTLEYSKLYNFRGIKTNPISKSMISSDFMWNKNFDLVLENQNLYPKSYSRVIDIIWEMKAVKDGFVNPSYKNLTDLASKNTEILTENYSWYPFTDSISQAKRKDYYFSDYRFYNRLHNYRREYWNWASQTLRQRALKIKLYTELKTNKLIDINENLTDIYKRFEMNQLKAIPCDSSPNFDKSIHNFLIWNVVVNTSKDTLFFTRRLKNNKPEYIDYVLPKTTRHISSRISEPIHILKDSTCVSKIISDINGYYINE